MFFSLVSNGLESESHIASGRVACIKHLFFCIFDLTGKWKFLLTLLQYYPGRFCWTKTLKRGEAVSHTVDI